MNVVKLPRQATADVMEPDWGCSFSDPADQASASHIWNSVVAEMREAGTLSAGNANQIKRYVLCCILHDREFAAIEAEGTILRKTQRKLPTYNPHWSIYRDTDSMCNAHEDRLGLNPYRRGKTTQATPKKPAKQSAADAMLGTK
jgi:P27 family predicted phage terminase small subunit